MGLLDQPNDLQLLGGGVSHSSSPPSAIMLFLSSRNSSACSATTALSSCASRRKSLTSPLVAARAVSPAKRRLPASKNSFTTGKYVGLFGDFSNYWIVDALNMQMQRLSAQCRDQSGRIHRPVGLTDLLYQAA